jgi:uncharacterized protein
VIRVLADTDVIISALLFPSSTPARALALVLDEHRLVLTDWIIAELHEVVGRKRPDLLTALDAFLDRRRLRTRKPRSSECSDVRSG